MSANTGDWTEDFQHENGNYQSVCSTCRNTFFGHKRRVTCKVCAETRSVTTDMIKKLRDIAGDPMWPDHVEVSKKTINNAADQIDALNTVIQHIANGHPNPQQFAKNFLAIAKE
jgi:hypothetical protein